MGEKILEWLRERRQKLDLFDETLVAHQDNPLYLMGPMLYYFWLVTVVTGVILMLWYVPTTTEAYSSIEHIQNDVGRSEEHTSELQSRPHLVCRLLLEKKKNNTDTFHV